MLEAARKLLPTLQAKPVTTGVVVLATSALLLAPDAVFAMLGWPIASPRRAASIATVTGIAFILSTLLSRRMRAGVLAFFLVCQTIWLGCLAYFGRTLGPEQFLLARFEMRDIASGAAGELPLLLTAASLVLLTGALAMFLQTRPSLEARIWRHPAMTTVSLIALFGGCAFWFFHKKVSVLYPDGRTPSIIGPLQAGVAALRVKVAAANAGAKLGVRDQSVVPLARPDEPVTVVAIMGESIHARRLSVFGHDRDTTPKLRNWLSSPPAGFRLDAKVGFSGGVATFGSVPTFLRMAYWPVDSHERGVALFDLAAAGGFDSWYYSTQSRFFLDLAGGAPQAKKIVAEEDLGARIYGEGDDVLAEFARDTPATARRRFVYFHQRVNHAPYTACRNVAAETDAFAVDGPHDEARRASYDNGLRCWDRNVAAIANAFLGAPGAVYVFITADHAELMGDAGLWGHGMADLRAATTPFMLLTNRPDGDVAKAFRAVETPTTYRFAQVVAKALGYDVATPGVSGKKFYLNTTMPFGGAGYIEVDERSPGDFDVTTYSPDGRKLNAVRHAEPLLAKPGA